MEASDLLRSIHFHKVLHHKEPQYISERRHLYRREVTIRQARLGQQRDFSRVRHERERRELFRNFCPALSLMIVKVKSCKLNILS